MSIDNPDLFETFLEHIHDFEIVISEEARNGNETEWDTAYYEGFLKADIRFRKASEIFKFEYPSLAEGSVSDQMGTIHTRFSEIILPKKNLALARKLEAQSELEYTLHHGELSESISFDGDSKETLAGIISQLRKEVNACDWMKQEQKRRVLKAVNSVQQEIDKDISNFHLLLGKIEDVGETLGKAGKKAKPAIDSLEQLGNAIRGKRSEQIAIEKDEDPLQIPDLRDEE